MSGCAGGNRISRRKIKPTVNSYISKVLSNFPKFKSSKISGSFNTITKNEFGDIDLLIHIANTNKADVKSALSNYLKTYSDDIIVPFKNPKYLGEKCLKTGEIVSVLYPIEGMENEFVQIDNIICISSYEMEFKKHFLDLPAEKQGLYLGLAKIIMLEEDPLHVLKKLNITPRKLKNNQEYEFNLSSGSLTLRIVTLSNIYHEIDRQDIYQTIEWNKVKKLFQNYKINLPFNELLDDIVSKLKNPRSINRIKGIFKSMITIKSGEVGTEKAKVKQKAIDRINKC